MVEPHLEQEWAKKIATHLSELERCTDESLVPITDVENRARFLKALQDAQPYLRKMSESVSTILSGNNNAGGGWYHNHSLK